MTRRVSCQTRKFYFAKSVIFILPKTNIIAFTKMSVITYKKVCGFALLGCYVTFCKIVNIRLLLGLALGQQAAHMADSMPYVRKYVNLSYNRTKAVDKLLK
jgi:hypothetical protein